MWALLRQWDLFWDWVYRRRRFVSEQWLTQHSTRPGDRRYWE